MDPSRAHAHGILDLVDSAVDHQVFFGEVTAADADLEYPYLVVWPAPGNRPVTTLAGYGGELTTTTQVTAVGTSVDEVLSALDRASAALHRVRPVITGRQCAPIVQESGGTPPQPQRTDKTRTPDGRPIFFSFALFTLYSSPV